MQQLINILIKTLKDRMSKQAIVFLISLMPILELRGGLIASSILSIPYIESLIICVIANFIPIPFILIFLHHILNFLERNRYTKKISLYLKNKANKHKNVLDKYGYLGLLLFVAIPLPGTGAWTGSLVASVLRFDFKKSIIAIFAGILIASIIMSIFSYGILFHIIHK